MDNKSSNKGKELKEMHIAENAKKILRMRESKLLERKNRIERDRLSRELRQIKNTLFHKKNEVKRLASTEKRLQTEQSKLSKKVEKEELDVVKLETEIGRHESKLKELQKRINVESSIVEKLKRFLTHETKGVVLAKDNKFGAFNHERGVEGRIEVFEQEIKKMELVIKGVENKIQSLK